jgi:hypothetical protein
MAKAVGNIALSGFGDIFGASTGNSGANGVTEIALTELHAPDCHPFQVNDDEAMTRLVESIREYGVREPGLSGRSRRAAMNCSAATAANGRVKSRE